MSRNKVRAVNVQMFLTVKTYAVEISSTAVFVVFVIVEAFRMIDHVIR